MPDDILDLADRLWRGEVTSSEYHPVAHRRGLAEVCGGVAFLPSFGNVSAFATEDGLVLVDTGSSFVAAAVHDELRRWSGQRLNTAGDSHGPIAGGFDPGIGDDVIPLVGVFADGRFQELEGRDLRLDQRAQLGLG